MKYIISAAVIIMAFVSTLVLVKCVFVKFDLKIFSLSFIYLTGFTALILYLKTKD